MCKRGLLLVLIVLSITQPTWGSDFRYVDPNGLYAINIPAQWIFQSGQSGEGLHVFYGPGGNELFYIEHLKHVTDVDGYMFASRTLDALQGPGGLSGFVLEECPGSQWIDGKEAVSVMYSYSSSNRNRQKEKRYFVILPDEQGVTITMSDRSETFSQLLPVVEQLIEEWRWLM